MDELACFVPGMLALGASGYGPEKAEQIMNLAKEVIFLSSPCVFFLLICMTFKPVVVVTLHIILQIFPYSATYFSNFPPLEAYAYSHRYS